MRNCEPAYSKPNAVAFSIDRILGLEKTPIKMHTSEINRHVITSQHFYEDLQNVKETSDDCKTPSPHYSDIHRFSPLKDNSWYQSHRDIQCSPQSSNIYSSSFERVSRIPNSYQPLQIQRPLMKDYITTQRHDSRIPSIASYERGMLLSEKARLDRHHQTPYPNSDDPSLDASRKGGQVRFTHGQSIELERVFVAQKYISPQERKQLANHLHLSERQVKTWFQNRRAKWRRLKMEAEMRKRLSKDNRINRSMHYNRKSSDSDAESDCCSDHVGV